MKKIKQRTLTIYAIVIALVITTIAYAVLSSNLSITGSINRKGNSWNIKIVNLEHYAGTKITTNSSSSSELDGLSGTSLSFKVTLDKPGDYSTIRFKIKNSGTLNAYANNSYYLKVGNEYIDGSYSESGSSSVHDSSLGTWANFPTSNGVSCSIKYKSEPEFTSSDTNVYYPIWTVNAGTTTDWIYIKCRYNDTESLSTTDATVPVTFSVAYSSAVR